MHELPLSNTVGLCTQSGPELTACLILMEVSNPCLHSRAIFKVRCSAARCPLQQL